jgi:L-alanine-DL-glutamate epimerase-like enolase superfamily enzyme
MVHACAVMPNALIGEYFPDYEPLCSQFGVLDIDISGGTATIDDAPGLGVRMNEDALAKHEL